MHKPPPLPPAPHLPLFLLQQLKHLLVELCLLLPAALRVLVELVLLPRLVKPLALALKGPDDLVALGLRTLEVGYTRGQTGANSTGKPCSVLCLGFTPPVSKGVPRLACSLV